jgi:hypothetical protein
MIPWMDRYDKRFPFVQCTCNVLDIRLTFVNRRSRFIGLNRLPVLFGERADPLLFHVERTESCSDQGSDHQENPSERALRAGGVDENH